MKRCIIMRGVPGSGKSTTARWIAETYAGSITKEFSFQEKMDDCVRYFFSDFAGLFSIFAVIHSTDEYFMEEGKYNWKASLITKNHSKNYEAFRNSIDQGISMVIVDNTNTTAKEYTKYLNYAEKNDYQVVFMVMPHPTVAEAVERNQHNVPGDVIRKMINRFE